MSRERQYQSSLRQEQADATRQRILEALVRVITADGISELSVPAVAKEAGVSVPTVYRHFGTKRGLVEAMGEYFVEQSGLGWGNGELPETVDELVNLVGELYRRSEAMDPALRAVMATDVAKASRTALMPKRLRIIERTLRPVAGGLPPAEFKHLRNVVLILCSSAAMRAFKEYLDLDARQASQTAMWAIRTLLSGQEAQ